MDVIHVAFEIDLIPYLMFPETSLPQVGFTPPDSGRAAVNVAVYEMRTTAAHLRLDQASALSVEGIVLRQRPDCMPMVRQQYPRIDVERQRMADVRDGRPQRGPYVGVRQHGTTPISIDREKE